MIRRRSGPLALLSALALVAVSACGSDGPDTFTVSDDESDTVATRPPRDSSPTTEVDGDGAEDADDGEIVEEVPPNGEIVQVRSLDNTYRPDELEVVAGTEVLWTNNGRNDHDVVPVDDDADWGVDIEDFTPGEEYAHVFGTPGVYDYYCSIHGTKDAGMIGSVVVLPADA